VSNPTLAARQAALVAALVAGGPPPPGFDPRLLQATEDALLHKRAGEVAAAWPALAAALGDGWDACFRRWARARPPRGALRDGWDLARELRRRGPLPALAATELALREAAMRYDGQNAPCRRRLPIARRTPGGVAVWLFGGST
jgi:hypothetical protein